MLENVTDTKKLVAQIMKIFEYGYWRIYLGNFILGKVNNDD